MRPSRRADLRQRDDLASRRTYRYFIGSARFSSASEPETGSRYRWLTNGASLAAGPVAEDLLLHFDASAAGVNGEAPALAQNLAYVAGKWGSCLALPSSGRLRFGRTNNLHLDQGTIELWVALRADGTNSVYSTRDHPLFHYRAPNGDYIWITQSAAAAFYTLAARSMASGKAPMAAWAAWPPGRTANGTTWLSPIPLRKTSCAFTWTGC